MFLPSFAGGRSITRLLLIAVLAVLAGTIVACSSAAVAEPAPATASHTATAPFTATPAPVPRATPEPATPVPSATPPATATQAASAPATADLPATPSSTIATEDVAVRIAAVESRLLPPVYLMGTPVPYMALADRMAHYEVPGVSIAVIHEGKLEWAGGYGVAEAPAGPPVDKETLFQAASISKPVTALAALRLVQAGVLDLDADAGPLLKSWQLPQSPLARTEKVTLRRLLSNTAGTTVSGFAGYPPGSPLPTTAQILSGEAPANSRAVTLRSVPGSTWNYSGGGYVIVQQLIEDVTGKPFAQVMQEQVFDPLDMTNTTFEQPLPASLEARAAAGHDRNGRPLPGKWRIYPELAAAGLWTTAEDVAKFALALQRAADGAPGAILAPELAKEMLTPGMGRWGLGVQMGGPNGGRWFAHGGANAGYRERMIAFLGAGKGAVVLTNGDNGIPLFNEILRSIADVYDWPDLQAREKRVVAVDPAMLQELGGRYEIVDDPGYGFDVEPTGDRLRVTTSDGTSDFYPESELVYFEPETGLQLTFFRDPSGAVVELESRLPTGSFVRARRAP